MENSSFGDEITMINKQLEQLSEDSKNTAEKVKDMLSKDEMKDFITTTITTAIDAMKKTLQENLKRDIDSKIDSKIKEKVSEVNDRLDTLTLENIQLRERLDTVEEQLKTSESLMQKAMQKSNYNEQYSRKNNIKVMGVPEMKDETIEMLEDKMCEILGSKANLHINPRDFEAIHRIPGKSGMPKPVLIKMRNNHEKNQDNETEKGNERSRLPLGR